MKYKIYPVLQGIKGTQVDASKFIFGYPAGKTMLTLPYGFFVLEDENEEFILVDTGIFCQEELDEREITEFTLQEGTLECLDAIYSTGLKIEPEKVKTIIITHLHWDHTQGIPKFPNANIYVQKKELQHAIAPYPFERSSFSMFEGTKGPAWLPCVPRFKAIDGDCEILPGIRVIMTPGHTPGHQAVLVDTEDGEYLILGDYVHTYMNLEECMPNGILVSLPDWYEVYPRVMKLLENGAKPLFMHEMDTYQQRVFG